MPDEDEAPRERVLLCAADWKDPDCRQVLSEFHKDGIDTEILDVDQDMQGFEKAWGDKGQAKFQSEYHKEGAPYLDNDGLNAYFPTGPIERTGRSPKDAVLNRKLDVGTVEVITYALFRAVFGYGVNIPIKRPGVVDMDVTIKGKDININTNEFYVNLPDLVVWRVVYSHQGTPIFEFGRGVKKGFKVHRLQALKLFLALRSISKKATKARMAARKAAVEESAREKENREDGE
ncbi:MAG: hypothetical protein AB9819_03545 [Methanomassiliicoccales archaeon]